MILVVGATGQVGSLVVRHLRENGHAVRALVRSAGPAANELTATGAELALGDLRDRASLEVAVRGVRAIVATANVVAPSHPGDTHEAVERNGYTQLITLASAARVRRFVYASVPIGATDDQVPQIAMKRHVERTLAASSMSWLALRLSLFTEVWLSLVGSELPLAGERNATLERPYRFLLTFRRVAGRTVEQNGRLVVPGPSSNRNAFISVHDVARLLANAVDSELIGGVDVGGPEALSWDEVAQIFADVLRRPVKAVSVPPGIFVQAQRVLAPLAPSAANIMALNHRIGTTESAWDTSAVTTALAVPRLRTVREVLQEKAALSPSQPT